jgi:hypothetical protein
MIIRLLWLQVHNLSIDWQAVTINFDQCAHPTTVAVTAKATMTMNDDACSNLDTSLTAYPILTKRTSLDEQ